jgi:hypothetical protein
MPKKPQPEPQRVIEVVPQYNGKTDRERVFGPKVVLATHGRVELTDHMAKTRARLDLVRVRLDVSCKSLDFFPYLLLKRCS